MCRTATNHREGGRVSRRISEGVGRPERPSWVETYRAERAYPEAGGIVALTIIVYRLIILISQQRVEKQLSNAREKLERAQRYTEDKKHTSQKTIDRLQREYDEMAIERRDNDRQVEEYRGEADNLELKVCPTSFLQLVACLTCK